MQKSKHGVRLTATTDKDMSVYCSFSMYSECLNPQKTYIIHHIIVLQIFSDSVVTSLPLARVD